MGKREKGEDERKRGKEREGGREESEKEIERGRSEGQWWREERKRDGERKERVALVFSPSQSLPCLTGEGASGCSPAQTF